MVVCESSPTRRDLDFRKLDDVVLQVEGHGLALAVIDFEGIHFSFVPNAGELDSGKCPVAALQLELPSESVIGEFIGARSRLAPEYPAGRLWWLRAALLCPLRVTISVCFANDLDLGAALGSNGTGGCVGWVVSGHWLVKTRRGARRPDPRQARTVFYPLLRRKDTNET